MSGLRKAVLFASAEQYFGFGANFVIAVLTSRLMAPNEIGIAVVGASIVAVATALREYATPNFLIRNPDISPESMRGPLTGIIVANIVLVAGLALAAPLFGVLYAEGRLTAYLKVVAVGLLRLSGCCRIAPRDGVRQSGNCRDGLHRGDRRRYDRHGCGRFRLHKLRVGYFFRYIGERADGYLYSPRFLDFSTYPNVLARAVYIWRLQWDEFSAPATL